MEEDKASEAVEGEAIVFVVSEACAVLERLENGCCVALRLDTDEVVLLGTLIDELVGAELV